MHMRYAPPMFMFHGPLMLVSMLFWLVLFALLIGLLVRRFSGAGFRATSTIRATARSAAIPVPATGTASVCTGDLAPAFRSW